MKKMFTTSLLLSTLTGPNAVHAEDNGQLGDLLNVLRDNDTITQPQYETLRQAVSEDDVHLKTEGGLQLSSRDGNFSFKLGGRLLYDIALYHEDKNHLGNGTSLRGARLETSGTVHKDWNFAFSTEITGDNDDAHDVIVRDAWIRYDGFKSFKMITGQYKIPLGLDEIILAKNTTFMERGLVSVFAPKRAIGLAAKTVQKTWTAAIGAASQPIDSDVDNEGDEAWGLVTRWTFSPYHSDTQALHLGVASLHRHTNDAGKVKFSTRPESYVTDVRYLDTGPITNVDSFNRYGFEAAGVFGPFSLQGEYILVDFDRNEGLADLAFDGWYIYGSWFLTGESRPYSHKAGSFGRITPKNKLGAWEVAARYSVLDLNDGPITGGKEANITLGLNWYINTHVRLMANYVMVDNDEFADANGTLAGDDDPDLFQMRVQLVF